jgi:restriction endonuclease S subunit
MWLNTVPLDDFISADSWKVEHFNTLPANNKTSNKPTTFPLVELGALFTKSKEQINPQLNPNETYHYIGLENIQPKTGELIGETRCYGQEIKTHANAVKSGAVLFSGLRPTLNKVFFAENVPDNTLCSREFFVLMPDLDKVRPLVLRELLSSERVLKQIEPFISGVTLPRISFANLKSIQVPLPPLKKQLEFEQSLVELHKRRALLNEELEQIPRLIDADLKNLIS